MHTLQFALKYLNRPELIDLLVIFMSVPHFAMNMDMYALSFDSSHIIYTFLLFCSNVLIVTKQTIMKKKYHVFTAA